MKADLPVISPFTAALLLTIALLALCAPSRAQTANWNNGAGDNDWNNSTNWDIGVPAEGTNAVIGSGSTVNYNLPMTATAFGALTDSGVLNINATGFVSAASGTISGSSARFNVNSGGAAAVTTGNLTFTAAAGGTLAAGGSLAIASQLNLGASGSGNTGFMTNNGGTLSAATTRINPNNLSSSCVLVINGGSNGLGTTTIWRSSSGSTSFQPLGSEGLVISNGIVNLTSLTVGASAANSTLTAFVGGGAVTNTGTFIVGMVGGANSRPARFLQTGGTVVSSIAEGIRIGVSNSTQVAQFSILGGTNIAEKYVLGDGSNSSSGITVNFTNAATMVVGSGGITTNNVNTLNTGLNNGGRFCAKADWTSAPIKMTLTSGGTFTFNAADLDGTPHNITLPGPLTGSGALTKAGGGTLTLNSAGNNYSGVTTISQGTLAIGAAGVSSSPTINVSAGAVYDVSAAGTATNLSSGQALGGSGAVNGNLMALSGSILRPGGLATAGTLTFSNGLATAGGGTISFDLSDDPTGTVKTNDLLNVLGDLNLNGIATVSINPLNGTLPTPSTYVLIRYGGNISGDVTNFIVTGAAGSLSLDKGAKTISLVVQSALRGPTNVVWLGGLSGNSWDTAATSNWLNAGTSARDIFVNGDNVRFDGTGAANPVANVVGSVGPSALVVDTSSNYAFNGAGSIDGSGGLTKTNLGTLTVLTTNGYLGPTIIGGGVLEAAMLANGNLASSIGSSPSDATNLQFFGSTLRYLGASTSTDRGATLNGTGGTIEVTNSGTTLTWGGAFTGTGALIKAGPGALTLSVDNTHAGGTVISNGLLRLSTANGAGSGGITNYSSTLRIATSSTIGNVVEFHGICTVDLNNTGGNQALDGAWSGDGTVNFISQQSSTIRTFTMGGNGAGGGTMANFTGVINLGTNNGFFRFNDGGGNFNTGNTNLFLDLGTSTAVFLNRDRGQPVYLGALAGGSGTVLTNGTDNTGTTTYIIGSRNVDSTMAGSINSVSSAPIALVKVGTGTLALAGACGYYGATTVSNGVLALSGSGVISRSPTIEVIAGAVLDTTAHTDGAITLNSGQTLLGEGTVRGSVIVSSNATLSPGPSGGTFGILTITNSLALQPGATLAMDADFNSATNDLIEGLASITYGGTLSLNLMSVDLTASFKLFNAASYGGAFDMITPASPGAGWVWDLSSLGVNGTLKVMNFAYTQPHITTASAADSNLTLSGTGGPPYLGYTVYSSYDVTLALPSWGYVGTGNFQADGSFAFTTAIDTNGPPEFYALQYTTP
ncbi:MAG TPA: autotransporter-associated beta strand repeat-containing protein [Candidatus Acidoferrum sp.]|nr:autotransporter-associated beta strand repeat-containing protein [Candidatus Acidoferrum sp.]